MKPTISIIGAGINGLVTFLALRLFGIKATIYEKSTDLRTEGAGIYIWPQGMQILAALVGSEKILSAGHIVDAVTTLTAAGQTIHEFSLIQESKHYVAPSAGFHCKRLYNILLEAVGSENIILNKIQLILSL